MISDDEREWNSDVDGNSASVLEECLPHMHTNEEFTPVPHQHEKRFLEEATEGPPAKRQPLCAPGDGFQNVCSDVKESPSSKTPIIVTQLKQLRLPVPCPVPTKFTKDVANAIKNNQLKGIMKTRLLRQAATFYWGCVHGPHMMNTSRW